jgi:hypothetical protein
MALSVSTSSLYKDGIVTVVQQKKHIRRQLSFLVLRGELLCYVADCMIGRPCEVCNSSSAPHQHAIEGFWFALRTVKPHHTNNVKELGGLVLGHITNV